MRILVTGVAGFVGRHLVSVWREQIPDVEIWGFVRGDEKHDVPMKRLVSVDLCNAGAVREACRQAAFDWVVHLAAQSFIPDALAHPRETWETNLWGTFHLLEALRESGFNGRFLFVGSGDQYGKVEEAELPIRETQPFLPRNAYAASKAAAEHLCYQYGHSYGLCVIVARPFSHLGPGQSPRFVISDFCRQVAQIELGLQEPVLSVSNLDVSRDFLDVRDVVDAYRCLLEQGKRGEAYNVCSGREVRLIDLVGTLVGFSSRRVEIHIDYARMRPSDTPRVRGSHEKLTVHTGWRPTKNIVASLEEVFTYWKEELEW